MATEPAKMKSFAVKSIDNLNRMDGMISDLLDSMAIGNGERLRLELAHFDIADVIKEVGVDAVANHRHAHFKIFGGSIRGWWDRNLIKEPSKTL